MKKISTFLGIFIIALVFHGCATPGKRTAIGAGAGAAVGAGVGALIGGRDGKAGKGAVIGGLIGAALGGTIGNRLDKQAQELAQIAETRRTEKGIVTKLKGDILFDTNSHSLKGQAQTKIDKIAQIISKYPEDYVTIVGHTDSTGSEGHNQKLSENRANTVLNRMIRGGVPASRIRGQGAGELKPIASNNTNTGRSQNRRVEINIRVDEDALK